MISRSEEVAKMVTTHMEDLRQEAIVGTEEGVKMVVTHVEDSRPEAVVRTEEGVKMVVTHVEDSQAVWFIRGEDQVGKKLRSQIQICAGLDYGGSPRSGSRR